MKEDLEKSNKILVESDRPVSIITVYLKYVMREGGGRNRGGER